MKNNQKGFSVVEVLFVAVVVGLIFIVGWLVYDRQHSQNKTESDTVLKDSSNSATATKTTPTDKYDDWATYKDEYVTFRYPKNWTVSRQYTFTDSYGALSIDIKAPVDSSLTPANTNYTNLHLSSSVIIAKNGRFSGSCEGCGQVFSVEAIETGDKGKGNLIISDSGIPGEPGAIDFVADRVAVGDKNYVPAGIMVGNNYSVRVSGNYASGVTSLIGFKTVADIKDSKQYSLLRDLIETIQIKASNLPK